MKSDHWLPLYCGDYLADTGHLTTAEHGAYLLLLMHQWRAGSIPDDDNQLARITRASIPEWKRMRDTVLAFFTRVDGALRQTRLERERAKAAEHAERRSKRAKTAAEARWKGDAQSMLVASDKHCLSNASECPRQPQPQRDTSVPSVSLPRGKRAASVAEPDGFADFWAAYPRRVGKGAALKAFAKAIASGASVAEIAAGLNRQRWPAEERFIPHPATWLNQARWQDDPGAAAPEPAPAHQPGKLDWLWREMAAERAVTEDGAPDFAMTPRNLLQ